MRYSILLLVEETLMSLKFLLWLGVFFLVKNSQLRQVLLLSLYGVQFMRTECINLTP